MIQQFHNDPYQFKSPFFSVRHHFFALFWSETLKPGDLAQTGRFHVRPGDLPVVTGRWQGCAVLLENSAPISLITVCGARQIVQLHKEGFWAGCRSFYNKYSILGPGYTARILRSLITLPVSHPSKKYSKCKTLEENAFKLVHLF